MRQPEDWLVPEWPAPACVRAIFTTRSGGVSVPPFDSFNLGDHVQDDPAAVMANRRRLADVTGARPVFLKQVHGTEVVVLDAHTPDGTSADACLASEVGLACTIMVADCLPVLFTNAAGTVVAAAHAGWRGLAGEGARPAGQGVLEATFAAFASAVQMHHPQAGRDSVAANTLAWLGPCIGPTVFEVGAEVRAAFVSQDPSAQRCFTATQEPGKYLANLPALARLRLRSMGVTQIYGNDDTPAWCTVTRDSAFFSHRRDTARLGSTGRMAACIWLT